MAKDILEGELPFRTLENAEQTFNFASDSTNIAFQALKSHAEEQYRQKSRESFMGKTKESIPMVPRLPINKHGLNRKSTLIQILQIACLVLIGFLVSEARVFYSGYGITILEQFVDFDDELNKFIVSSSTGVVKRGPDNLFETVDELSEGSLLGKMELEKGWYRIDYGKYIHRSQVQVLPSNSRFGFYEKTRVSNSAIPIYEAPHHLAHVLNTLGKGDYLDLKKIDSKWAKLKSGGFVEYKKVTKNYGGPVYMRVSTLKSKVFSGPSESEELMGYFSKNKIVKALISENGWVKVGSRKYVKEEDLKPIIRKPKLKNASNRTPSLK